MLTFLQLGNLGRFGNQLFQVASTIGIAEKTNQRAVFPTWEHPFVKDVSHQWPDLHWGVYYVPWGYHDISVRDKSLHGYMQSEKYFIHCEEKIREQFTFQHHIKNESDFIAVHVRRGDYTPEYYTILGKDYYDKAISMLPDLPVYLFTDDVDEARNVVPNHSKIYSGSPFYDLNMMTRAKYHVIANSSFSWWGAWLSDSKKIIAPGRWFGPKSPFDAKDIYSSKFTVIYF